MTALASLLDAEPLGTIKVSLPSSRIVPVSRYLRHERRVDITIPRTSSCWAPNKPSLASKMGATWAEFAIVRQLELHGWEGRWIKNWVGGREMCLDVGIAKPLPEAAQAMFARIDRRAASRTGGGAWDVFAWRDDSFLVIESKQHSSSDRLRPGQVAWLEAGLAEGLSLIDFAVVEYDAGPRLSPAG